MIHKLPGSSREVHPAIPPEGFTLSVSVKGSAPKTGLLHGEKTAGLRRFNRACRCSFKTTGGTGFGMTPLHAWRAARAVWISSADGPLCVVVAAGAGGLDDDEEVEEEGVLCCPHAASVSRAMPTRAKRMRLSPA